MSGSKLPSTRELVSEGEKLRGDKDVGEAPPTRELINESERLLDGRSKRSAQRSNASIWLLILAAFALATAAAWLATR